MTIDHIVPLTLGGTNHLSNLVLACYACNQHKGELSYLEYLNSEYLRERRASIGGQVVQHQHEAIKFTRSGNWSCLCGETGRSDDDPKTVRCTLRRYGAFYQP